MEDLVAEFYRGDTAPIRFSLLDADGAAEDVTGWTRARMELSDRPGGTSIILATAPADGAARIDVQAAPAAVVLYLTLAESLNLPLGRLHVGVRVELGGKLLSARAGLLIVKEGLAKFET